MCEVADWTVLVLLGIAGVIDWRKREIPMWLLVLMSITIFIFSICCKNVSIWYRLAGALFGVTFFIISKFTKEAVGYGDSWLILLLGVHLGILEALQVLFAASIIASIFAVFFLWKRGWKRRETMPFVPFLVIAYAGVMIG